MHPNRRSFLQVSAGALAALALPVTAETRRNGMPCRALGRTGQEVSLLCLGGAHIGGKELSDDEAIRIMRTAVDEGVNFFDNAWAYHDGRSEERMGRALKDGYRDKVYLMTKHRGRDAKRAQEHLEDSLRRLDVDVIDLWQIHEVIRPEEADLVYSGGAIEFALKMREQGKIRHIGFTGHHITTVHAEIIARGFPWDTVQMPLNCFDAHYRSFEQNVLPKAVAAGIGVIAMKTMGGTPAPLPGTGAVTHADCLRYAMSLPVAAVCSGMDSMDALRANLAVAKAFTPMEPAERAALLARTAPFAKDGAHETYKTQWHLDIQERMRQAGIEVA
jgi:predicted aldo/keto reductase-like oxidoreductase